MSYAVLQTSPAPPRMEQLQSAFHGVPGLTAADAAVYCKDAFGIIAPGLEGGQAAILQTRLREAGVEAEIVETARLPALPVGKTIRRLELTPEAMVVWDPLGRPFPVNWGHIMILGAGCLPQAQFQSKRHEWKVSRFVDSGFMFPIRIQETRFEYRSSESAAWQFRAEIVLTKCAARFCVEAENFNFGCLGPKMTNDPANNFNLLMREFANRAPLALLNRGVTSLLATPPEFTGYPRANSLSEEVTWLLWQIENGRAGAASS